MIPLSSCDLCGARDVDEVSTLDRHRRPLQTVICRKCGLVWTDPIPPEEDLLQFYSHEYRLQYKGIDKPTLEHVYRGGKVAVQRFQHLKELLKPASVIVDVGSGGGEFVYLMRLLGFDVQGVQPHEGYARYSQEELGIPVHLGFVREVELPPEYCHMVTLYHALEHMATPSMVLEHISRWLQPQGWLVIEVPNVEATCQSPGHRFHQAHLYSFNPASLQRLGQKAGFGLYQTHLSPDGGNVTVILRKETSRPLQAEIPGNYERIMRIVKEHTPFKHFTSPHPYIRPLKKLSRSFEEKWATRKFSRGKELLDSIRLKYLPTISQ